MEFGDASLPDRFWDKTTPEPNSGCWLWVAGLNRGYGRYWALGHLHYAHRIAFAATGGLLDPALELDHTCHTPCCVRPDHMDQVTHIENVARGNAGADHRAKTHCRHGHPYDEQNTYRHRGKRYCRTCRRRQQRAQS